MPLYFIHNKPQPHKTSKVTCKLVAIVTDKLGYMVTYKLVVTAMVTVADTITDMTAAMVTATLQDTVTHMTADVVTTELVATVTTKAHGGCGYVQWTHLKQREGF
jgi:hypothetical protein